MCLSSRLRAPIREGTRDHRAAVDMSAASSPAPSSPSARTGETSRRGKNTSLSASMGIHRLHAALAPRIAVINSPDVDEMLDANNINGFAEFLRPFQGAAENISVRTSQLETRQCPTFPLVFDELEAFYPGHSNTASTSETKLFTPADVVAPHERPSAGTDSPQQPRRRKQRATPTYARPEELLDAISGRIRAKSRALWALQEDGNGSSTSVMPAKRRHRHTQSKEYRTNVGLGLSAAQETEGSDTVAGKSRFSDDEIERYRHTPIEELTPWFTDMRDMVLWERSVSEHETFGHPVAVIMAVSSSSPDPLNAFAALYEASQATSCPAFSQRPYVDPLVFRYYLLIHDVARQGSDLTESVALLDNVKRTYGIHCCLLQLNSAGSSRQGGSPSSHTQAVSDVWRRTAGGKQRRGSNFSDIPPATPSKNGVHDPKCDELLEAKDESGDQSQLSSAWYDDTSKDVDLREYALMLDDHDVRRISTFVRDFAAQSLVPFMERCVSLWNEQLAASRRGLTSRIFGAGRKLFGSATRGSQGQAPASFSALGFYPHTTLEAQTRRLADFAFMTRDYKLAAAMYDYGRRDFLNDKAYKFSAGANEMFGLSHLMLMLSNQSAIIDVDSYLATAVHDYLLAPRQHGSALQMDALRATLLYYECYTALSFYRSAPFALARTATQGTSEQDDLEVVSAMLFEQAAICALRQPIKPALRRCALYLVMAAHKYGSCGQKHLSLRTFHSAAFSYRSLRRANSSTSTEAEQGSKCDTSEAQESSKRLADEVSASRPTSWSFIDDHMELELAQQAYNDGRLSEAVEHYLTLLQQQGHCSSFASDDDSSNRHDRYLRGFLMGCRYLDSGFPAGLKNSETAPSLGLVDVKKTRIGVNAVQQSADGKWQALEREAFGHVRSRSVEATNTSAVHEPFCVHVALKNHLSVTLAISSLSVSIVDDDTGEAIDGDALSVQKVDEIVLQPFEERLVNVFVVSTVARNLRCVSVSYKLDEHIDLVEQLTHRGRRLNDTKQQRAASEPVYAPNPALLVAVRQSEASLHASFPYTYTRLALGEEVQRTIVIKNSGRTALQNIRAFVSPADAMLAVEKSNMPNDELSIDNSLASDAALKIALDAGKIDAQSSFDWPVVIRGACRGVSTLRLLIVYETISGDIFTTQAQHTLHVDDILDIALRSMPNIGRRGYNLDVSAVCLLEANASITVEQLTLIAPRWRLQSDHQCEAAFRSLRSDQVQTQTFTMQQADTTDSDALSLDHTSQQLKALLNGKETKARSASDDQVLQISSSNNEQPASLSAFFILARRQYRLNSLAAAFPSLVDTAAAERGKDALWQIKRIFPLYEPNHVDLIVHWKIDETERRGQSFVFGLHVGPSEDIIGETSRSQVVGQGANGNAPAQGSASRTMYAETTRQRAALASEILHSRLAIEEDPILLAFDVPKQVSIQDDLDEGGCHLMDIKLNLYNLSNSRARRVTLQLDHNLPSSSAPFASFVNRLTHRATLPASGYTAITAQARVSKLGIARLAPVLVRSSPADASEGPWHEFERWELCTSTIEVQSA